MIYSFLQKAGKIRKAAMLRIVFGMFSISVTLYDRFNRVDHERIHLKNSLTGSCSDRVFGALQGEDVLKIDPSCFS